jgi:hypothetical protein
MSYRSSAGSSHSSGRGGARSSHEKAKTKGRKHLHTNKATFEETDVKTSGEVIDRTLSQLSNLGKQKFATSPFREHFSYWITNVKAVLSEFESEPSITVDDQFTQEISASIGKVENELDERRRDEISLENVIKSFYNNKTTLEQTKSDYANKTRELTDRKNVEISCLSKIVGNVQSELSQIALLQAGFFRGISKKAKAAKQEETARSLHTAQRELELAQKDFAAEQKKLDEEYTRMKSSMEEQMNNQLKLMENQEVDFSAQTRSAACDSLAKSVKSLMQRQNPIAS